MWKRIRKMFKPIRCFLEDVWDLLPVKFHPKQFSGCREEVENASANQRPERPSLMTDQHDKHKLVRRS